MNKETGKLTFEAFYSIAANFLEDEDDEAMQNELKEAFRLYDKEGVLNDDRRFPLS
jgi:calmodulin